LDGLGRGGEAAFGVGCAAERQEDGFVEGLAGADVGFDFGAGEELGVGEDGAVVAGVGEVEERGSFDVVEEGNGDNVDGRVWGFVRSDDGAGGKGGQRTGAVRGKPMLRVWSVG
jgi:hypothetical protein